MRVLDEQRHRRRATSRYLDTVLTNVTVLWEWENLLGYILDQIIVGTRIPFESGARPSNDLLVDVIVDPQ